jgi:hypothetical protein
MFTTYLPLFQCEEAAVERDSQAQRRLFFEEKLEVIKTKAARLRDDETPL